jgi:hypothetical protein
MTFEGVVELVVDHAVHRDDVVEAALPRRQHVADGELNPAGSSSGRRSRAFSISVGDRSTA